MRWLHHARRSFADFVSLAASVTHLECVVPTYISAVIASFRGIASLEPPDPKTEDAMQRTILVTAAVLPLTEMLAQGGPFDLVPVINWMIAGGVPREAPLLVQVKP